MQDNKPVYQVQACSQEEVDVAFKAAKEAQRDWAKVQPLQLWLIACKCTCMSGGRAA
jgi:acyl-CoA reductase-like NAD-dependent aldehyde dehydrogenase